MQNRRNFNQSQNNQNNENNVQQSKLVPFAKPQSELMSRKEAAEYLQINEQTLAVWKCTQRYDLPVVKIGRLVRYKKSDLDKFIESRTVGLASNE